MDLYGYLVGEAVMLSPDQESGKPIYFSEKPDIPFGYVGQSRFVEDDMAITQVWSVIPETGTVQDAAIKLARMQAETLTYDQALEVPALYDEWTEGVTYYGPSDPDHAQSRVLWKNTLYKCLTTHVSQGDWAPDVAPSLFAKVLPGQAGNVPESGYAEWEQPGADNGYAKGDKVLCDGHLWESTFDGSNVWKPGDVGAPWTDLGVYPPEESKGEDE